MDKAQLDALLAAHGGRAQAVASLHVLRSASLGAVDHAFLARSAASLATLDLSRWRSLAGEAQRPAVIDALVSLGERDPSRFEHEIARAPHFGLSEEERTELVTRLVGRAPESVIAALAPAASAAKRKSEAPRAAAGGESEALFDPGEILSDLDFEPGFLGGEGRDSGAGQAGREGDLGDLLGSDPLSDGDLFGGADPFGGPAGGGSATPALDALLADLPLATTPRARAAWKRRSLEIARDPAEDWGPRVTVLTGPMQPAVLVRAGLSTRGDERAALLEWLFQSGARRALLVDLSLGVLSLGEGARGARGWLSQSFLPRLLPDRPAWGKHGAKVLDALASNNAYSEMDELIVSVASGGASLGPGLLSMGASGAADLAFALFSAMSAMLVGRVTRALAAGDRKEALAGSAALASLGIPPRSRSGVLALARKRAARGEIATLLALAASRARRPSGPPGLEDLVAAVHVLSDAMS